MQPHESTTFSCMRGSLEAVGIYPYELEFRPEMRLVYLSAPLLHVLGFDEGAPLPEPRELIELITPSQRAQFKTGPDGMADLLEGPLEVSLELADGRTIFLRQCGAVTRDADGRPERIQGVVRDVTPLTQTLQALRESETRYESLLETAPFGVILYREGRVLEMNPAARAIVGVPDGALDEELHVDDFLEPDEAKRVRRFGDRRAAGLPVPKEYETIVRTPKGERRHILVGVQQITFQGVPTILASLIDISDRKRAEEELAASRARFQSIVETAPEGMFVEHDGRLVYANETCRRLLGAQNLSDIIGTRTGDFLERVDSTAHTDNMDRQDGPVRWSRFRAKSDRVRARHLELATMDGEFGGRPAQFGILRDVSTQVRFQRHLEGRIAFESLLCQVSTQFINAKPDEVDTAIQHALEQIGIMADVDRCFLTLITPDIREVTGGFAWAREGIDPHDDIMQGVSLDEYPHSARCLLEEELLHIPSVAALPPAAAPERSLFEQQGVLSTIVLPLYCEGVWRGFFGMEMTRMERTWPDEHISSLRLAAQVFSYAINRKQTEEERQEHEFQMQTAQKMETLGVLAGGIAHDFNNLLTAILGNATVALQELPAESTAHECVSEMERAAQHAAQLVRQMLLYAGRGKSVKRWLDLNHLVADIAQLLRTSISKKAELAFDLASDPPAVEADETQLRQVVMNLITNASQALGDEPGVIRLRTGTRALTEAVLRQAYLGAEAEEGDFAFVEVEDTGSGMTEDVVERMFDPFFTSKQDGTGLGLAATLGIVRSHRGIIELDTTPGKGTRFTISLPRSAVSAPPPPQAQPVPADAAPNAETQPKGRVLIVDDEPVVRAVARRILERGGYEVLEATNGEEGLQSFQEESSDIALILLDMAMPVMDGEQAFFAMRAAGPMVPVIFSSGYLPRDAVNRLLREPATAFVGKPYRPSSLLEVVSELVAKSEKPTAT